MGQRNLLAVWKKGKCLGTSAVANGRESLDGKKSILGLSLMLSTFFLERNWKDSGFGRISLARVQALMWAGER